MATGSSAATKRAEIPKATTPGPDSHTIFRMGGTLRSAERRSCQLLQKFSLCDICPRSRPKLRHKVRSLSRGPLARFQNLSADYQSCRAVDRYHQRCRIAELGFYASSVYPVPERRKRRSTTTASL